MTREAIAVLAALGAVLLMGDSSATTTAVPATVSSAQPYPPPDPRTQVLVLYYDLSTYPGADTPFLYDWKRMSPAAVPAVVAESFSRYPSQYALELCRFSVVEGNIVVPIGCAARKANCYILPIATTGPQHPECNE